MLDVKPWEADTDLEALWHKIIEYKQDGLVWGETFKLEPVAYGIKKLVMTVSIEDKKVCWLICSGMEAIDNVIAVVGVARWHHGEHRSHRRIRAVCDGKQIVIFPLIWAEVMVLFLYHQVASMNKI